ncbi:MAG: Peptidoglycan-associated lipoprotein [bacterium]|nr:Peptidoglycan-associated lipoprotein [bacterium]
MRTMMKLKTVVIALTGLLLVACSPRVNQPPPLSELEPPTDEFSGGVGSGAGSANGPAFGDSGTGTNIDTTWGGPTGETGLTRRPGGDWSSNSNLETIYFDYDKYDLTDSARRSLLNNAEYLRSNPQTRILVEGNCDDRGTEEYNQALGENRALSVREYLVQLGISPSRIDVISYGELRPAVEGSSESSRSQNRRAEFKVAG